MHPQTLSNAAASSVRAQRARLRWSQRELAHRMGWSHAQIAALETGHRDIYVNDLPQLCKALGLTLEELLHGGGPTDLTAFNLPNPAPSQKQHLPGHPGRSPRGGPPA